MRNGGDAARSGWGRGCLVRSSSRLSFQRTLRGVFGRAGTFTLVLASPRIVFCELTSYLRRIDGRRTHWKFTFCCLLEGGFEMSFRSSLQSW